MKKASNEFDPFLNECQIYVWEWYIPEQKVRFGIPSLNSLWIDDQEKNIKLATMLERVHPDDIQKVLVRHTSPLYRSDKMFEVDLRLNVAAELMPDGQSAGRYEWYGFRGKTLSRDRLGRPTYVRGVAINLDQRYRAQQKLIDQKQRQLKNARSQADYCSGVIQEVGSFIRNLAQNADTLIASDGSQDAEGRLIRLSELKDQAGHILELTDKVRYYLGGEKESVAIQDIQPLSLWEHMAELQQVYSLKAGSQMRFYFSNLYDSLQIFIDVKLFDLLLDNAINALIRANIGDCIVISYIADPETETLQITITSSGMSALAPVQGSAYSLSGLGLSVSRLISKRIWGDIEVESSEQGKLRYVITLPLDARKSILQTFPANGSQRMNVQDGKDVLDGSADAEAPKEEQGQSRRASLPHVLIGMRRDADLYRNQHLFEVSITCTTDEVAAAFAEIDPDIVFIDSNLPGQQSFEEVIERIHQSSPDTPIIVTDDVAPRPLHKQVQQCGARYLLNNPLTLRKVNMMIKKYLK